MRSYKKCVIGGAIFAALLFIFSACEVGKGPLELSSVLVKNVELKDNQINIYASRPLEPGIFMITSPQKMVVEMKNATVAKDAAKSGQGSGDMIKSWSLEEHTLNQGDRSEGEPVNSVRLSIDLTRDTTYRVSSESFGCSLTLLDLPKAPAPAPAREAAKAVVPVKPNEEREAARTMLKEISSSSAGIVTESVQSQAPQPAISGPKPPKAKVVTDVAFSSDEGSFEATISGDGSMSDYKYLRLDNPARVVVDIFGVRKSKSLKDTLPVNNNEIREVRVGAHPDYVRVVIELKGNFKDVKVTGMNSRLVIRILY